MLVKQFYTGCLAQAAYYIESNGEAAVVDPLRDMDAYLDKARENNARIKYIFETHFHADFVSGHLDLSRATGADIVYGPTAAPSFPAIIAADRQQFTVGKARIEVLHTPGHTMESCCFLLYDEDNTPVILFSGDTLFLGDVGRPDLAQKAAGMTQEQLAGLLYDSIREKILPLPDHVVIYPGHGAGSACGKHMSEDRYDTLWHQKQTNYALRPGITRKEFITEVTTGLTKPPAYFPKDVMLNKQGYDNIEDIIHKGTQALSLQEFIRMREQEHALVLDARPAGEFIKVFIPGAINIGIDGDFAPWAGIVIPGIQQPILLITEKDREQEAVIRLSRVGYDNCIGFLEGGFETWLQSGNRTDHIHSITAEALAEDLENAPVAVLLDVRRKSEYDSEHVIGAENCPLNYIYEQIHTLDKLSTYYVYCAAGYRSVIFISLLKSRGYHNFINIAGGFKAIKESGRFYLSKYQQPITML